MSRLSFASVLLAFFLVGCGTPPKEYITWKGCVPGEEATFVACDQLHVVAGWSGACSNPSATATCYYNPPPGYVLLDTSVRYNSGPSGRTSYSPATIDAGAKILSRFEIEAKYNQAIDLAGKWADIDAQIKLKEELGDTLKIYDQIETNKNLFRGIVTARGDGSCVDRKRSWINVTVTARAMCMGVPESKDPAVRQAIEKSAAARSTENTISCCAPGNSSCVEGSCKANELASCELDKDLKPVIKCTPQ